MVLLSPSLSLPRLHFIRNHRGSIVQGQKNCRLNNKAIVCSCASSKPIQQNGFCRRDLVLFGLSSSLSLGFPTPGSVAGEDVKMASFVDEINAYTYLYPMELPSKKFLFKWVESRKPERYSSAAPLSPNARLRIVSERVDIIDNLIISVTIGPPNVQFLKSKDKSTWNAKDVADSVLSDKSALRVTSSQRMAESSVLDAHTSKVDGSGTKPLSTLCCFNRRARRLSLFYKCFNARQAVGRDGTFLGKICCLISPSASHR
ncbi:hypothetical protein CICLE_v10009098mg [Citrus x clementina]|uniref:PsbP C-terminal domain-containing protein n=2 Tax=Citrus TaxID=2706 RepID=A0A067GIV5_CITSI|nr:hypothetical protein CICLE_v10009098mg [Citrus x clementina]KDO79643.1 hypothetical protein CISIN_1g020921mg [Citrus sinensis]